MIWQDWVFSVGSIIFVIALIPSIRSRDKPALSTSMSIALTLITFVVAYASLKLWLTAVLTIFSAACWFILAFQKHRQSSSRHSEPFDVIASAAKQSQGEESQNKPK